MLLACDTGRHADSRAASSTADLNYGGSGGGTGNKQFGFSGYEIVDSSHINLFFNHKADSGDVDDAMFSVKKSGGSNLVTSVSTSAGNTCASGTAPYCCPSGINETNLTTGTKVTLTLRSPYLEQDEVYTVRISTFLADNNSLTLGNYGPILAASGYEPATRDDWSFTLKAPDFGSSPYVWSGTPATPTYSVWSTSSPGDMVRESNVVVVFDRPIDTSTLSTFLSNLDSGYTRGGTAVKDIPETYAAVSNNGGCTQYGNNTFVIPLTKGGNTTAYNRSANYTYTLNVPQFTGVNSASVDPSSFSFTTMDGDIPGWLEGRPTAVTGSGSGDVDVYWSATALDSGWVGATSGYHICYSTSQYSGYSCDTANDWSGATPPTSGSPATITLDCDTAYYIRVVPYNSLGPAGFSIASASVASGACR
jgi:hypothetical protein